MRRLVQTVDTTAIMLTVDAQLLRNLISAFEAVLLFKIPRQKFIPPNFPADAVDD